VREGPFAAVCAQLWGASSERVFYYDNEIFLKTFALAGREQPWALKSLSADLNLNALKDTYDYSC
jgi:hypothetical protein